MGPVAAPPSPRSTRQFAFGAVVLVLVGLVGCERFLEARIQVVADDRNVYLHQVPTFPGSEVQYRLPGEPVRLAPWDAQGFFVTVPLVENERPLRGAVPIELRFRTVLGIPWRTNVVFDADAEQVRRFGMGAWSGGWHHAFRFEGDHVQIAFENERCVRWRYGLNGEEPTRDVPEYATFIDAGDAHTVKFRAVVCKPTFPRCTYTLGRDGMGHLDC